MTISTVVTSSTSGRKASRNFSVSVTVMFIFQFAAMIFLRMLSLGGDEVLASRIDQTRISQ